MPAGRPKGTFKRIHPCRVNGKVTKTYQAYQGMIARCHNLKAPNYRYYGAKGTSVCERWRFKDGYDNFVCDVGVAPPGYWLDRKENSKGYEPGNVRWVTPRESANNRKQGGGKNAQPMSLRSLCMTLGVPYMRTYFRVNRFKWTYSEAFREITALGLTRTNDLKSSRVIA